MTDKPMSNMAKRIIDITVKNAPLYPSGVARNFGYIESIIDRGFSEGIAAEDVVQEIQNALDRIANILAEPAVAKAIEEQVKKEFAGMDMGAAFIICHDCKLQITSVYDHFIKNSLQKILNKPLNKQFEKHIDHDLSITIPKENMG